MGEEEIENLPLRDIFHLIWSVKLFLYKFRGICFPSFYSLCQRQSYSLKSDGQSHLQMLLTATPDLSATCSRVRFFSILRFLKSFVIQPSVPSPLAPISITSLKRKLAKHQQNGAQNAPRSAYNSPKVIFFRTFGLL